MKLPAKEYRFCFLTPCFCGTADADPKKVQLRVPPIRGHLRHWHRALFNPKDCNQVWGSAAGEGESSRISGVLTDQFKKEESLPILPHKDSKQQVKRQALGEGSQAAITLQRLPECTDEDWNHAQRAVRLWLLVGGLGLRVNRAAGSVWPLDHAPQSKEEFAKELQELEFRWHVVLLGQGKGLKPPQLRKIASDTPKSPPEVFGSAKPRCPSPLKMKVVQLGSEACLLLLAKKKETIEEARKNLQNREAWNKLGENWLDLLAP